MAQVNISIDSRLKEEGQKLFGELGVTFSEAVNAFVTHAVLVRGIPLCVSGNGAKDITLASEKALAKDWLLPVEDAAWGNL